MKPNENKKQGEIIRASEIEPLDYATIVMRCPLNIEMLYI
jgi:hypothetical protein